MKAGTKRPRSEDASAAKAPKAAPPSAAAAAKEADALGLPASVASIGAHPSYVNKQRVLIFGTRGITARYRHLMNDVRTMIPHHKKDAKLDAKDNLSVVNEIAASKSCTSAVFFEVRKKRDLYLWVARTPNGPSIKFHVVNVHTMDELRMTGNCLRGSRPILSFDRAFDDEAAPHLRLTREILAQAFATPRGHPKSQPFHDHVISFGYVDGKIWFRHYQIVDKAADAKAAAKMLAAGEQPTVLVEIGPRFVLDIIRIFAGSMGGPTLYQNEGFIGPNMLRHELNLSKAQKYAARAKANADRRERREEIVAPEDPLADVFDSDAEGREGEEEDDEEEGGLGGGFGSDDDEDDEDDDGGFEDDDEEEEEEELPPPPPAKKAKMGGRK